MVENSPASQKRSADNASRFDSNPCRRDNTTCERIRTTKYIRARQYCLNVLVLFLFVFFVPLRWIFPVDRLHIPRAIVPHARRTCARNAFSRERH